MGPEHEQHYRVLGVRPGATHAELVHAYRVLAKAYHPDSASGSGNAAAFIRISHAYQTLVRKHAVPVNPRAMRPAASWTAGSRTSGFRQPGTMSSPLETASPRSGTDVFSLGRTLLFDPNPAERARAARDLGWSGKSAAYTFLRKAFLDGDERVRVAAVRSAGSLGILHAGRDLAALYCRSGSVVKREILLALMGLGPVEGASGIVSLGLQDRDPSVRLTAQNARKTVV